MFNMWLEEIFKTILMSSVLSSILAITIILVKKLLGRTLNPTFHYYIWILLILKLLFPYGPENKLSIYTAISSINKASNISVPVVDYVITDSNLNTVNSNKIEAINQNIIKNDPGIDTGSKKVNLMNFFSKVWITGIAFLGCYIFIGIKNLTTTKIINKNNKNKVYTIMLEECSKTLGVKESVNLIITNKLNTPCITGLFRPTILIPEYLLEALPSEKVRYVILHELIHFKRKDILINNITLILGCVYWFNPIILYAFYKMKQDCETSCDTEVLSMLNTNERISYGNTVIDLSSENITINPFITRGLTFTSKSDIKRRIIMIKEYKRISKYSIIAGVFLILLVGFFGLSSGLKTKNEPEIPASANEATNISMLVNGKLADEVPPSSSIVIYNTHADEEYTSGMKVTDVSQLLHDKLNSEGLSTSLVRYTPPAAYNKAYSAARDVLTTNIKDYNNKILLDIHRDSPDMPDANEKTKTIMFVLAKSNPNYEENKKFTDKLIREIESAKKVNASPFEYNIGIDYFNQTLSNRAVLIEIGNGKSSNKDLKECIEALVESIKSVEKGI